MEYLILAAAVGFLGWAVFAGARMMTQATDRLTASLAALSTAVDSAVTDLNAPVSTGVDEATINGFADQVDGFTKKLNDAGTTTGASGVAAS